MVQDVVKNAEVVRDLKGQIAELTPAEAGEVIFIDVSPGRRKVTIYSMETGEPISIPSYMVKGIMDRRLPDGGYAFTSDPSKAPEYKLGTVKCFLHRDSPDRPVLKEIGLDHAFCPAAHLPNEYEKRIHAEHRHRKQWEAYQHYLDGQRKAKQEERQEQQIEATLAMAQAASGKRTTSVAAQEPTEGLLESAHCKACGKDMPPSKSPDKSLAMHQRMHCPARPKAPANAPV